MNTPLKQDPQPGIINVCNTDDEEEIYVITVTPPKETEQI
jgi:hypothetical protein